MRQSKFKGKEFYFTEKHWKQLLKRFDVKNVEIDIFDEYKIRIACPMCEVYQDCFKCPLEQFGDNQYPGCEIVLSMEKRHFILCLKHIIWKKEDDKKARTELNKIHQVLIDMQRVKKGGISERTQ